MISGGPFFVSFLSKNSTFSSILARSSILLKTILKQEDLEKNRILGGFKAINVLRVVRGMKLLRIFSIYFEHHKITRALRQIVGHVSISMIFNYDKIHISKG